MSTPVRSSRYSGRDLPACRIIHTGRRDGVPPAAATRKGASAEARRADAAAAVPTEVPAGGGVFGEVGRVTVTDYALPGAPAGIPPALRGECHARGYGDLRRACRREPGRPVRVTVVSFDLPTPPRTGGDPAAFSAAVASMDSAVPRPGIELADIRPPKKLAPFSHAVGLGVVRDLPGSGAGAGAAAGAEAPAGEGDAFGRLILLHDPAWDEGPGLMRVVSFLQADMDAATVSDPLLPQVAWEWLTDGLDGRLTGDTPAVDYRDLRGTVTATTSVRHGDIGGPPLAYQLELRASWTATDTDLASHVRAFAEVLAMVADLPPTGVAALPRRGGH